METNPREHRIQEVKETSMSSQKAVLIQLINHPEQFKELLDHLELLKDDPTFLIKQTGVESSPHRLREQDITTPEPEMRALLLYQLETLGCIKPHHIVDAAGQEQTTYEFVPENFAPLIHTIQELLEQKIESNNREIEDLNSENRTLRQRFSFLQE